MRARRKYGMPYGTKEEYSDPLRVAGFKGLGSTPAWESARKLSAADRMEIGYLRYEGVPPMEIAQRFGIARSSIYNSTPMERPYGA